MLRTNNTPCRNIKKKKTRDFRNILNIRSNSQPLKQHQKAVVTRFMIIERLYTYIDKKKKESKTNKFRMSARFTREFKNTNTGEKSSRRGRSVYTHLKSRHTHTHTIHFAAGYIIIYTNYCLYIIFPYVYIYIYARTGNALIVNHLFNTTLSQCSLSLSVCVNPLDGCRY